MKKYESKLAQFPKHCIWCICLYTLLGLMLWGFFYLAGTTEGTTASFIAVLAIAIGQCFRFHKMCYKINDDVLIQFDFQFRTIFIEQIYNVRVLKDINWVSLHVPYNIIIETIDKEKYYLAPKDVEQMVLILKEQNPSIKIIRQ